MRLRVKATEWTPKRALPPKVEIPKALCQAIWNEIDRISTQLIANPIHTGKMRVQDNHYDVVKPRDCDPEKLLVWLKTLPDDMPLRDFNVALEKFED